MLSLWRCFPGAISGELPGPITQWPIFSLSAGTSENLVLAPFPASLASYVPTVAWAHLLKVDLTRVVLVERLEKCVGDIHIHIDAQERERLTELTGVIVPSPSSSLQMGASFTLA